MENCTTKTTHLGNGLYGCRVWHKSILTCETRVSKIEISSAFKSMFRMLDKCGYDSEMAHASRHRNNHMPLINTRTIWY